MIKAVFPLFLALSMIPLAAEDFKVSDVIHPVVAELNDPAVDPNFGKGMLAISSSSEEASLQVTQGMARLTSSWDFEAYRHFCAAAKKDPDCMMAFWGIAMSLAGGEHEFYTQREVAVDRMLDLLEAGQGVEIERGYVEAAGRLLTGGVREAGKTFEAISKKFPADIFSKLFSLFLLRDGYDSFGDPRPGQRNAMEGLRELLKQYPDNYSVLSFWVGSQSESSMLPAELRKEVLPFAGKLVEMKPNYPPFHLKLAHVEARCGNASRAIASCRKAIELFEQYLDNEKVSLFDCEGLIRSKVYLAHLLAVKGELAEGMKVAAELAKIKISEERVFSKGAVMLLWEARTIGARLSLGGSTKEEFEAGLKNLDTLPKEQWFQKQSLVGDYRDALALCLGIRKALLAKDRKAVVQLYEQFLQRAKSFETQRKLAAKTSSYSAWLRALNTMNLLAGELRGALSELEEGAMKQAAVSWYGSAADLQGRPENLLPPSLDYPIEMWLGRFYLSEEKADEAAKAFRKGLYVRPNHLGTLEGYRDALLKQGREEDAAVLDRRIEAVKNGG
ncbi:MAG: hypothetical protein ACON4R_12205 [Akkermansiaceae bacterium]